MNRPAQKLVPRLLALCGALGVFGAATAVLAAPLPERAALEARVADMRRHLLSSSGDAAAGSAASTLGAQAARWNNWPNWSNWANWRNS